MTMTSATLSPTTATAVKPSGLSQLSSAIAFEWTKLISVRSTWWNMIISVLTTIGLGVLIGASVKASGDNGYDVAMPAPHLAFELILAAEFLIMLLATLFMTSEYSTGSIKTTLQSVPVRARMLLSKVVVVVGCGLVSGLMMSMVGTATVALFAGEYGTYTAPELFLTTLATAVSFALLSVLALGLATVLRSATGTIIAIIVLFGLPRAVPIFNLDWLTTIGNYLPTEAASVLGMQASDPYGWSAAILVLLGWAVVGVAAGYAVLRRRDA
jgi:ABC-2 type transport system permease protein